MDKIHPILKSMIPIADALGKMMGSNCEVAIHDLTHPQHSIIHIVNGHVTGRKKGDTLGKVFNEFLQITQLNQDMIVNYSDYDNGTNQKCTKILIKDENNRVIGCFCINIIIDEYLQAMDTLKKICETIPIEHFKGEQPEENNEDVFSMVKELIKNTINEVAQSKGKMTREEKIEIVKFLDEKGVFKVKGAVEWVANNLSISRFTVYSYLDQIRS